MVVARSLSFVLPGGCHTKEEDAVWSYDIIVSMKVNGKEYSATEFKAKCLKILDELGPEGIVVTKRGAPIARVMPVATVNHDRFYGCMRDEIVVKGDIFSTGRKWNAQSRHAHPRLVRRRPSKS